MTDGHCSPEFRSTLVDDAAKLRSNNNNSSNRSSSSSINSISQGAVEERQVWGIGVGEANREELVQLTGDESRVLSVGDIRSERSIKALQQVSGLVSECVSE